MLTVATALRSLLLVTCIAVTAGAAPAAQVLSNDELAAVRGAAGGGTLTCNSGPCIGNSCGWVEARGLCVQVDNDCRPTATCGAGGTATVCCSDAASDCYHEKTLTPVDPGNCTWACNNKGADNWSPWSGWMGSRQIHCRYQDCP